MLDEHWGTRVSFNSGFLGVYAQQWNCWVIWQFYFQFFGMHNYLLAAGYVELDDEEIRNVRNRSIDRVRRTHGYITFEDAVEEERDFGTDD